MKYRDYFSLKTLNRFGVEPDTALNTSASPEEIRENVLASFGTLDEKDLAFLTHKTDCALLDMRLIEPEKERESIEIPEANDRFEASAPEIDGISAPDAQRTL